MKLVKTTLVLGGFLSLSACFSPEAFETDPIKVPTSKGDVHCQVYTHNSVTWDRSIAHPRDMSVYEADKICVDLGYKLMSDRRNLGN